MYAEEGRQRNARMMDDEEKDAFERPHLEIMDGTTFFDRLRGQDERGPYHYYTSSLNDIGHGVGEELLRTLDSWEKHLVPRSAERPFEGEPFVSTWIGGKGSTTQAHYDVLDNVFLQMYGSKTFYIWPPSAVHALHVYPDAHPRARKSQIPDVHDDAGGEDRRRQLFPLFSPSVRRLCRRITLSADQGPNALFLPAFTFHHVIADDVSVSLNVFSLCDVKRRAGDVLSLPAPFFHGRRRINATRQRGSQRTNEASRDHVFLRAVRVVLGRLNVASGTTFVRDMYTSRFRPSRRERDGAVDGSTFPRAQTDVNENTVTVNEEELDVFVDEMVSLTVVSGGDSYAEGIKSIVLAHAIEKWAIALFGAPKIADAIARCGERLAKEGVLVD